MCVLLGASTDMGFSAYWPTLLFFAPSFAGLLSGAANSLAHISGFAAPHLVANVVDSASLILLNRCLCILLLFFFSLQGGKSEWNKVFRTLNIFNALSLIVFASFGSTKIQPWDPRSRQTEQTSLSTRRKNDSA